MVENIVAIELAYINTKHPDFHKDAALVPSLLKADHAQEQWNRSDSNSHQHRRANRNASPHIPNHQNNIDEQPAKTNEVVFYLALILCCN